MPAAKVRVRVLLTDRRRRNAEERICAVWTLLREWTETSFPQRSCGRRMEVAFQSSAYPLAKIEARGLFCVTRFAIFLTAREYE